MTKKDPIPEIRQRPTPPPKTDRELLDEYFHLLKADRLFGRVSNEWFRDLEGNGWDSKIRNILCEEEWEDAISAIETELGMDKINAERIRRLEERVTKLERRKRWFPDIVFQVASGVLAMLMTFAVLRFLFP